MLSKQQWGLAGLLAFGLVLIIIINANVLSKAENKGLTKAVFYVA